MIEAADGHSGGAEKVGGPPFGKTSPSSRRARWLKPGLTCLPGRVREACAALEDGLRTDGGALAVLLKWLISGHAWRPWPIQ